MILRATWVMVIVYPIVCILIINKASVWDYFSKPKETFSSFGTSVSHLGQADVFILSTGLVGAALAGIVIKKLRKSGYQCFNLQCNWRLFYIFLHRIGMINDEGVWNIKMLKRYCIRIMMTCLLAIALCVTWNAFTGVSLLEIVKKYEGTSAKEVHAAEVKRNVAPSKEVINALEQANDWSKYRSIEMTATGYTSGIESTGKRRDIRSMVLHIQVLRRKGFIFHNRSGLTRIPNWNNLIRTRLWVWCSS